MKKILVLSALFLGIYSQAQTELIAYPATGKGVATTFVTDYHALGINPANLGWQQYPDKKFTTGSSEFGMSIYSESLSKQDLRDNIWGVIKAGSLDTLSQDQKIQAARDFGNSDFAFNLDYNMFGFAYQSPKFGGIAVSIRTRASWSSNFSNDFSNFAFQGFSSPYFDTLSYFNGTDTVRIANYENMGADSMSNVIGGHASVPLNLSDLLDGTYLRLTYNREYHIGYGRQLFNLDSNLILYAGVGAKYIQGIAYMDLNTDNGNLSMISAMSPGFNIDYGMAALSNPSAMGPNAANFFRSPVGEGFGFDFGVNAMLFKKLHLGASVTNIGQMTYFGNIYEASDTLLVDFYRPGMDDMNIANTVPEMLEETGILNIRGKESFTTALPATLRFGGSLDIGQIAHVGIDLVAPFNDVPGSFNGFAYGIGGDIMLFDRKIILMGGFTGGGGYAAQIPIGINFSLREGSYEFGIASRDAITFFLDNKPTLSTAFGFARVRF